MKKLFSLSSPFWMYLSLLVLSAAIYGYHFLTGWPQWLMSLGIALLVGLAFTLLNIVVYVLANWQQYLKRNWLVTAVSFILGASFFVISYFRLPELAMSALLVMGIAIGILWIFLNKSRKSRKWTWILANSIGILSIIVSASVWTLQKGKDEVKETPASEYYSVSMVDSTTAQSNFANFDYAQLLKDGDFTVKTFTYGSGTDKNRVKYAEGISYQTESVNAELILPEWDSLKEESREDFLGFGIEELPLNGRVYLPEKSGPSPLLLVVHGNHSMIDWSDEGYEYLGKHLASRGIIVVSLDENFLNGHWSGDFRGKEMPARAWLLLKHLQQWEKWTSEEGNDLFGKVDWDQIYLAGHSRGGEAVQIASVYNELDRFPENGNLEFDFHFNIKAVISLAPTDYRYDRQVTMSNVNYLSIQGSYDSDESSFWGLRAFRRLEFTDSLDYIKAGIYIHRANHSQFNSSWGNSDAGVPFSWFLNEGSLISAKEQQDIAKFYITAFLERVGGRTDIPKSLFKHPTAFRELLADTYILNHYEESGAVEIVNYSADPDLNTEPGGVTIRAFDLPLWKETDIKSRDDQSLENYAVILGWYRDSLENRKAKPRYTLQLDTTMSLNEAKELVITLGVNKLNELKNMLELEDSLEDPVYDLRLELKDNSGKRVSVLFSEVKKIPPLLETQFSKLENINEDLGTWEIQTETYHFSRDLLAKKNDLFDLDKLAEISLIFDQNNYGSIVIDRISLLKK